MFYVTVPIFVLLAAVAQCSSAENYAYVKVKVPIIKCTDIPNDGVCPRDHKIPDFTKLTGDDGKPLDSVYNKTFINNTLTLVNTQLFSGLVNETCKNSYRRFFCSQVLPDCKDDSDFFTRNGEETFKLCEKAEKACIASGLNPYLLKSIINCSSINSTTVKSPKRFVTCLAYPDIKNYPYQCLPRNYKVAMNSEDSRLVNCRKCAVN